MYVSFIKFYYILRHSSYTSVPCLVGAPRHMGCQTDVWAVEQSEEWVILAEGLGGVDVASERANLARKDSVRDRLLVANSTSRGVDDDDTVLHRGDALARDHSARFVGKRNVKRNYVALAADAVDIGGFVARFGLSSAEKHAATECRCDLGDFRSDTSATDYAPGLTRDLVIYGLKAVCAV